MTRVLSTVLLPWILSAGVRAQAFEFVPGTTYDPDVPGMKKTLGHAAGERLTSHAEVMRYCRALAAGSANVILRIHGKSWEGRELVHLVIGSQKNLAGIEAIQRGMARLADPRGLSARRLHRRPQLPRLHRRPVPPLPQRHPSGSRILKLSGPEITARIGRRNSGHRSPGSSIPSPVHRKYEPQRDDSKEARRARESPAGDASWRRFLEKDDQ
jgi:hypothetical protein